MSIKESNSDAVLVTKTSKQEFLSSKGWFENLKSRFGLHNIKVQGETGSADVEATKVYPKTLAKIIEEGGYKGEQIFNADETGLNWKKMPRRTYISKNEKVAPGFKAAKDRITLLLCSNASGDYITKPLFINRSLNPRALKNVDKSKLPVYWRANSKAWITSSIFRDWFLNCFVPEVETYLKIKNIDFKVLLILDNAPGHPKDLNHPNVEIVFLPPNTTSIIQPLDQGIISTFKAFYIRQTFQLILDKMDSNLNMTVTELWKNFSILNCITIVEKSLKELKQSTLNGSWKNIWPEIVAKNNAVPPLHVEVSRILTIGQRFSGEGFDDMNEDDIYEIMNEDTDLTETDLIQLTTESPSVSNLAQDDVTSVEDICESIPSFTLKRIREGLSLVEKMKSFFTTNDPSLERSSKIIREIDINLAPYYEIEKELKKTTHQKLITDFAIIKPVEEPQGPTTSFLSNSENYVEEISSDEAIAPPKRPRAKIFEDSETD